MAKTEIKAKIGLDTTAFQRGMARSQKSVNNFVKNGIAKFGALAGAAGLGMLARSAIDLGSKLSDLAVQMNIGTTELQVLDFAAREAGVGTEILARALRNVQLRTEEAINGNKSYGDAFKALGIDIVAFKKLRTEEKLEAIAKAQANATDKAAAYNAVSRILGEKAGPALQEVLQNLAGPEGYGGLEAAAKRAGEVMSVETIQKMDDAADAIESFKRRIVVATAEILKALMTITNRVKSTGRSVGEFAGRALFMMKHGRAELAIATKKVEASRKAAKAAEEAADAQLEHTKSTIETTKAINDEAEALANLEEQLGKTEKKEQEIANKKFLRVKELEALQLRAAGKNPEAEALEKQIELTKKAMEIAKKYGISLAKAAQIVKGIADNLPAELGGGGTSSAGGGGGGGQTTSQAKKEARKKGIRFETVRGSGGSTFQQRFVDGKKAGKFSEAELAKAAAKRPQAKDPAQEAAAQTKALESIEREIKKNPS